MAPTMSMARSSRLRVICDRMLLMRFSGSTQADRRGEIDPGESVSAGGIVVGSHVDRDRHRQRVDRHALGLVVEPQRAAQAGQVGVVDRAAGRLRRPVQVAELDVDRIAARRQAAPPQHRRRFGGRPHHAGARHARSRRRRRPTRPGRGSRARRLAAAPNSAPRTPPAIAPGSRLKPLPHQVVRRQVLRNRQRRSVLRRRVALEVVEVGEHLDAADAVGDGVAEMHHQWRPGRLRVPR